MPVDTSRIQSVVDVDRLANSKVVLVGVGGGMTILEGLVRAGVPSVVAIDPDSIDASNVARQAHDQVGVKKVRSAETKLRAINSEIDYLGIALRTDQIPDQLWAEIMSDTDLLILATDSFEAQAFGNKLALQYAVQALWIGLYVGAGAGELVWWTPDHKDCFRCLMEFRYLSQAEHQQDPDSEGALIQDLHITDGIAGHLALALLTRGGTGYFGGLIERLGDSQFLQIKLRHDWLLAGVDPVANALGISPDNESYICWNSIVRRNGPRLEPCPDCIELLGREFNSSDFVATEISDEEFQRSTDNIGANHVEVSETEEQETSNAHVGGELGL